mmetsp:Transcript_10999/g.12083  ORF Transcript_10999/g.12083 Transcript_10999/m.12083 type:complete len:135 (-) Transcript_10999:29-433(-)
MQIVVGSTNPLKVKAVQSVFPQAKVSGLKSFQSSVSEEPEGKLETYQGALYRATYARKQFPLADMWIGVESGFDPKQENGRWIVFVATAILQKGTDAAVQLWSAKLACPITQQQRLEQIAAPLRKYKEELSKNK